MWLNRLAEGGRLLLPITIPMGPGLGKGIMVKVVRQNRGFSAKMASFVAIYSCTSARDAQREPLLKAAMASGALMKMKWVRRDAHEQSNTCVLHGPDVCLSSAEIG